MVRWALTVKQYVGSGDNKVWEITVIDEVTGTREQALAALWQHALNFRPKHPMGGTQRRRVLRDGEDFLVINEGVSRAFPCWFRAQELLWDSGGPVTPP
jgi:hypothetical protein